MFAEAAMAFQPQRGKSDGPTFAPLGLAWLNVALKRTLI